MEGNPMALKHLNAALLSVAVVGCTSIEDVAVAGSLNGKILSNLSGDCADHVGTNSTSSTDVKRNTFYSGTVSVAAGGNACSIASSAIPNHNVNDGPRSFRNTMSVQNLSFSIPSNPRMNSSTTALSHRSYDAVMLNGVPVDILSAGCYDPSSRMADANGNTPAGCRDTNPWLIDPPSAGNFFGEDSHNGHTQPDGTYHYHANPMALFSNNAGSEGSPVIGFAADGFPIYGSYFKDASGNIRKAQSSYTLKSGNRPSGNRDPGGAYTGYYVNDWEYTASGDLDECNGITVNGQYGYYITDSYPWILKCHKGTPDRSFSKRR
jgi:hypothetical protein